MQLTFEEIKKIIVGAVRIEQADEGIRFWKCTKKQREAWYNLKEVLGNRADSTTGIRMDFWTDSSSVTIEGKNLNCDIAINGLLTKQYPYEEECYSIQINLPEGLNRLTVYFPNHNLPAVVKEVSLDDGALVKPHTFDRKILFIGDSITQGWNSGYASLSYAYLTSAALNAESVIHGIGQGYYDTTTFDVSDFDPDIVSIAYGTNDFVYYGDFEEFQKIVTDYLGLVKNAYGDKKVFVITPIWRFDDLEKAMGTFDDCRSAIKSIAESYGFTVVDGYQMVPHIMDFYADDVHPNALGFSMYARNLAAEIKKHI